MTSLITTTPIFPPSPSQQERLQQKISSSLSSLMTCTNIRSLSQIHAQTITIGLACHPIVVANLVEFYARFLTKNADFALLLLSHLQSPNLLTFNRVLRVLSSSPLPRETLKLYFQMIRNATLPNHYSYPFLFKACAGFLGIKEGKEIHGRLLKSGLEPNIVTSNSLVHLYAVCGLIGDARKLFDEMDERNVIVWSTLINGYARNGQSREALAMFVRMISDGFVPNKVTMISVLFACGHMGNLWISKWVHGLTEKLGIEVDVVFGTSLIDMYCKCSDLDAAVRVFSRIAERDSVIWNALITGFVSNYCFKEGLELFYDMVRAGVNLEGPAFISAFKACTGLGDFETAKRVLVLLNKSGTEMSLSLTSSIIDMHMTFGDFKTAFRLFEKMAVKDVVVWTSMITRYAQHGYSEAALIMLKQMVNLNVEPNEVTLTSILSMCAQSENLSLGTWIHRYIKKHKMKPNVVLYNSLIDMYSKCGSIEDALQLFHDMPTRDLSSWNIIINALARHGACSKALHYFTWMVKAGIRPNSITFVGVLSACSHAGFVDLGRHHFDSMGGVHGIEPALEHYACMVDMLGRAGLLKEAEAFIDSMPMKPDAIVWGALLGSCRIYGNLEIAERTVRKLIELDPDVDGVYVLLSKIYAEADRWEDAKEVRRLMEDRGVRRSVGCSWIEVNGVVHLFHAGDRTHTEWAEIHKMLDFINQQMKSLGFVPAS